MVNSLKLSMCFSYCHVTCLSAASLVNVMVIGVIVTAIGR